MSRRGYARRRDANEPAIVAALEAAGASVTRLDGAGVPDLLIGYACLTLVAEVKLPLGPRGGTSQHREAEGGCGDLTRDQVEWHKGWRGEAVTIVRSPEEAIAMLRAVLLRAVRKALP